MHLKQRLRIFVPCWDAFFSFAIMSNSQSDGLGGKEEYNIESFLIMGLAISLKVINGMDMGHLNCGGVKLYLQLLASSGSGREINRKNDD